MRTSIPRAAAAVSALMILIPLAPASAGPYVTTVVHQASVTHNGGATWSSTYPPFTTCAGGTETNGGDFQRASDPWVTFAPNGDAYFISLSLTFVGPTSSTGTGVLVSKSTDGGDHWSDPVTLVRDVGDADVAPFFFNDKG